MRGVGIKMKKLRPQICVMIRDQGTGNLRGEGQRGGAGRGGDVLAPTALHDPHLRNNPFTAARQKEREDGEVILEEIFTAKTRRADL